MQRTPLAVLAILQLGFVSAVAQAQEAPPQTLIGQRVRILMAKPSGKSERIEGNVVAEDERTLKLERPGSDSPPVTVERSIVSSVERSVAKSRKGHGAAIGFLIGALTGAAVGYAAGDDSQGAPFCTFDGCATLGPFAPSKPASALLLGAVFGLAGAGIGAAASPGERWQRVPKEGVRLSLVPVAGGGVGARLSLSFSGSPRRSP
jgi:RNase P/RNase MRP subunit p29